LGWWTAKSDWPIHIDRLEGCLAPFRNHDHHDHDHHLHHAHPSLTHPAERHPRYPPPISNLSHQATQAIEKEAGPQFLPPVQHHNYDHNHNHNHNHNDP
jgi:hypothetical protein